MKRFGLAAGLAFASGLVLMACTPSETTPAAPAETAAPAPEAAPPAEAPPAATPPEDACSMAAYASFVGQPATAEGVPPEGPSVRHIRPDTQVTMDFRPDRLNIDINAEGVITGFRCG
jgi:hypothetical protein